MSVSTWVLLFPIYLLTFIDTKKNERKYCFPYLFAYLWLLELFPFISASYIVYVIESTEILRFLSSMGYMTLSAVSIVLIRKIAQVIHHTDSFVLFLFPFQLYHDFFVSIFFLTAGIQGYFYLTLVVVLVWMFFQDSGVSYDVLNYLSYHLKIFRRFRRSGVAGRIALADRAKLIAQSFFATVLVCVALPIIVYSFFVVYSRADLDLDLLEHFAVQLGYSQNEAPKILYYIEVMVGAKIAARLLTILILRFKIFLFNRKCIKHQKKILSMTTRKHANHHTSFFIFLSIQVLIISLRFFNIMYTVPIAPETTLIGNMTVTNYTLTTSNSTITESMANFWLGANNMALGQS